MWNYFQEKDTKYDQRTQNLRIHSHTERLGFMIIFKLNSIGFFRYFCLRKSCNSIWFKLNIAHENPFETKCTCIISKLHIITIFTWHDLCKIQNRWTAKWWYLYIYIYIIYINNCECCYETTKVSNCEKKYEKFIIKIIVSL